jgi:hypothetical protein
MGRKKSSGQPSRKSPPGQSSLAAQRKSILRSPDWITIGLAFCNVHGPWSAWEQRMLKELSLGLSYDFPSAVKYSRDVLDRPWPDLEPLLVGLMPAPDLVRLQSCLFLYFVQYVRDHNGSSTLKSEILANGSPAAAFAYAAYGTRRPWQPAESLILSGDTATSPALCPGIGDILDRKPWESQAVTYARLFLPTGWPDLEAKMAQGGCHPQVAYEYALKVLKGPLPQPIENWLTLEIFDPEGAKYKQKYFAFAAAKRSQKSPGNPSPPP